MLEQSIRRLPAERARHAKRRLKRGLPIGDTGSNDNADGQQGGNTDSFTLTAPVTVTIVNLPTSTNAIVASSISISSTVTASISTRSSSSAQSTSTFTTFTTISTPTPTPSSSPPASSSASSAPDGTASGAPQVNSALGNQGLPGGAIAGIVIVILLVVIGLAVYAVRKRFLGVRRGKTAKWDGMLTGQGQPYTAERSFGNMAPMSSAGSGPASPGVAFARAQAQALGRVGSPIVASPAASYNNPPAAIIPANIPKSPSLPSNYATVQCTFIPSLPDELSISTGENVRVLMEYDDGWALCANTRGEQGMVPIECLGRGDQTLVRNMKRASSLAGATARRSR